MQLEVVSDKAKFAQLKDHWHQLAVDQPLHSWEWMFHWWDAFQDLGSLTLLVVRDQDRVVGIAPWFVRRTAAGGKQLCFLGSGKTSTDYLRILSTQDCATEVLRLIRQAITEGLPGIPKLDCLELEGISATDQQMSTLIADLQQANFDVFVRRLESTWAVDLPSDWDTFVQSVRKQYRRKIRSALRRIDSAEFTFKSTATGEDFQIAFERLVRLHQRRWESRGEPGCFADPQFERFLRTAGQALANRNACEIVWCEYQGTPIVSHIYLTTD
ncbi:MAG: GNAT family N-acetyltransferase, partial [Planctomycetales bacterium]|nr:GNAT family N-acetyltransferase [Planctomycetales bacterium]